MNLTLISTRRFHQALRLDTETRKTAIWGCRHARPVHGPLAGTQLPTQRQCKRL
jgi:hypothetical protein